MMRDKGVLTNNLSNRADRVWTAAFEYTRSNRTLVLIAAVVMMAAIGLLEVIGAPSTALGFLYIIPLVVAAGFLTRWQIISLALIFALLREAGSPHPWAQDYLVRILMVAAAFAGAALFVKELARNHQVAVERVQELRTRQQLEHQLRHAQRLEAVGRLAGGVAHDFNNLLSVIIGFGDLAMHQLEPGSPVWRDVEEMRKAAERAAGMTRQLLEFSRREMLQPAVIDLNQLVSKLSVMLRRLIGEDMDLRLELQPQLKRVKADAGSMEQVIMNLVVNARDAMPNGGTLTIETTDTEIEGPSAGIPPGLAPGSYVTLSVRDTGAGMERAVQEHLFEPFFTTKDVGKGTGLGLSTVYGIVKQNGGDIWFRSEKGQGTTFTIYLPPTSEAPVATKRAPLAVVSRNAPATVLLVEDDESVRALTRELLNRNGLTVIEAPSAPAAIALSRSPSFHFDLLLTDVVMPQMSGPELARQLAQDWPRLNVLFMTGYAGQAGLTDGDLKIRSALIRKPFSEDELMRSVRAALNRGAEPQRSCA
jgi:signal transduction histidine kinase/CheY-like chemotaxis protein